MPVLRDDVDATEPEVAILRVSSRSGFVSARMVGDCVYSSILELGEDGKDKR